VFAGPAAADPDKPGVPDAWQSGPPTTFQFWRFDGEFVGQTFNKVYVLGGRLSDGTTDGSVWSFDPVTGTSTDTGVDLAVPVSNYTLALLQDSTGWGLYVFGGRDSAGLTTQAVQAYYPATNTAVNYQGTDPWDGRTVSNCLPFPGGVAVYNNKAYVFGGYAASAAGCPQDEMSDQTWVFDPMAAAGSKWTNANAPLSQARAYIATAVLNGMVYALGGDVPGVAQLLDVTPRAERIDPANLAGGWQMITDMPNASSGLPGCDEGQAVGLSNSYNPNGIIVYAGCGQWPSEFADTFVYTAATNSWAPGDPLIDARRNHAGAFIPPLGTSSTPAFWVFDGRQGADTNILTTTEYWLVQSTPTSVELARFEGNSTDGERPWSSALLWTAVLAGAVVLGLARLLLRRVSSQ
jgi:hypothetical protein